jgi:preprotein translocase subunit SecY
MLLSQDYIKTGIFLMIAILVIGLVIFVNEAMRKVQISYAKRRTESGLANASYIPLKLNQAGVIPIIFAVSLVLLPSLLGQFLSGVGNSTVANFARTLSSAFNPQGLVYNLTYFFLVFGFTYFYTSVVFNPEKVAENLQKSGGFITGIRPGKETEKYLGFVLSRLTVVGGMFLGLIAVLPSFFQNYIGASNLAIGGTSILIVVSVALQMIREMEGELVMGRYDRFIK